MPSQINIRFSVPQPEILSRLQTTLRGTAAYYHALLLSGDSRPDRHNPAAKGFTFGVSVIGFSTLQSTGLGCCARAAAMKSRMHEQEIRTHVVMKMLFTAPTSRSLSNPRTFK